MTNIFPRNEHRKLLIVEKTTTRPPDQMTFLLAWLWLFVALMPLLVLERWIHRHMQGIGLLVTRDHDLATILYSAIFLPSVVLHETRSARHTASVTLQHRAR